MFKTYLTLLVVAVPLVSFAACSTDGGIHASEVASGEQSQVLVWSELKGEPESDESGTASSEQILPGSEGGVELVPPEEIRILLQDIPYAGVDWKYFDAFLYPLEQDETATAITDFIAGMTGWWGVPAASFANPEEAPPEYVLAVSFESTKWVQWSRPADTAESSYHPELKVMDPYLPWGGVKLHRHLEETAKNLFGTELRIDPSMKTGFDAPGHSRANMFAYYDELGVYQHSREAFGFGSSIVPVVLSYAETGGGYTATCVFVEVFSNGDGYNYCREATPDIIPEDRLTEYLHTEFAKHTITLKTAPDGGFYYWSHILPE